MGARGRLLIAAKRTVGRTAAGIGSVLAWVSIVIVIIVRARQGG